MVCHDSRPDAQASPSIDLDSYDQVVAQAPEPEDVEWIFGYGSIIFKQGFTSARCVPGYLEGWKRVFYQGSTGTDCSCTSKACMITTGALSHGRKKAPGNKSSDIARGTVLHARIG